MAAIAFQVPVFLPETSLNERRSLPPRIPQAIHRHAAPSGPWPWSDLVEDDVPFPLNITSFDENVSGPSDNDSQADNWKKYPENLFPNWTKHQVARSGIARVIKRKQGKRDICVIYHLDVGTDGHFSEPGRHSLTDENESDFWTMMMEKRPDGNRVRLLFVENLSGGVLQMLGTKYKIEPFFFSSSLNWIPSRYQEDVRQNQGDHITITLTFLRAMPNPMTTANSISTNHDPSFAQAASQVGTTTIDTQAPLILRSNGRILLLDLLAFHMVRRKDGSTVISYHPTPEWKSTSAQYLHSRVRYAGESVYWQSLFRQSQDPTFVLLSMLWYALYAWDEALESLYDHICWLESRVLVTNLNDIHLTRQLHIIRASLLHYTSLLESFRKAVIFLRNTSNPAMQDRSDFSASADLLNRECDTLISEIERLEMFRKMQEMRLENILNLAFASVNFEDSRYMQRLSQTSLRDGAAMKQISYLTMVFLPASLVASVFGMNLSRLESGSFGTWAEYFAVAIPLTVVTIWIIVALHTSKTTHDEAETGFLHRLRWPIRSTQNLLNRRRRTSLEEEPVVV